LAEDRPDEDGQGRCGGAGEKHCTVRLLGREVPVSRSSDGGLLLAAHDAPAAVRAYFARAFGDRLGEVRAAMEALAAPLPPEELNSVGLRLYERFRPEVPQGVEGWGARAMLDIGRIVRAAE
jgi:hypothetical protein